SCVSTGTLAAWTFPTGFNTAAPVPSTANVTASAAIGAGLTAMSSTQDHTGGGGSASWGSNGSFDSTGALSTATNDYFQFAIDTTGLSSVDLSFWARRPNGNAPTQVLVYYYDGVVLTPPGSEKTHIGNPPSTEFPSASNAWESSGTITFSSSNLNPSGSTYFRIYGAYAKNNNAGSDLYIDDVTFTGCITPAPPRIAKAFLSDPVSVGGNSALQVTLTNPNSATALNNVSVTDPLPAGLEVSSSPSFVTTCAGTPAFTPSLAAGATTLNLSGVNLPAGGSCTVTVNYVRATTAGAHVNVTGFVSGTVPSPSQTLTNYGANGSATDTLTALLPPVITKLFETNPILAGGTSMLTFTVTNPNPDNGLSGVAFSDTFPTSPAAMTVASPAGASTSGCGSPVFSPSPGAGSISFSSGAIAAGGTCTVSLHVTAPAAGSYINTSGNVSTIINAATVNGNTDSDTLAVNPPSPGIRLLKQISTTSSGPWLQFITVTPGSNVYYRFTIENTGDVPLSPVNVTDPTVNTAGCAWPSVLPVASQIQDPTATCVVGPVTAGSGPNPNTATAHGTYNSLTYNSDTSSASYLGATPGFSLLKQVGTSPSGPWSSALSGLETGVDSVYYRFLVINTGGTDLTSISVTDVDSAVNALVSACNFTDPLSNGEATACVVPAGLAQDGTHSNTATAHSAEVANTSASTATYTASATQPDLSITKSDNVSGSLSLPGSFTWTLVLSNAAGAGDAVFADGQVLLSDPLPSGPTYGSPAAGSFTDITNSANLSCSIVSGTLRC
ncbi:MAG TPA: hypothetical protein VG817_11055, partial [Gemmatimonadales bacterium]|nr:hypothetical protein [Gemmatimonadales bacterium]